MSAKQNNGKVGAVAVIGGGVGGVQAALDLAESGYKVYLVDKSPVIGGVMAQLDKTFPTNDCSMCILAPKLVDCGRHPNIEIITCSDIEKIDGRAGNFTLSLKKRARYVSEEKCTGCGECATVCPVVMSSEHDEGLSDRKAVYRPYAQAIPNLFIIEKKAAPLCRQACPIGTSVQGYLALITQGKYNEALDLIRMTNPLPAICGRVCSHPCETDCERNNVDEPLSIRALKRVAYDYAQPQDGEEITPPEKKYSEKIAIIGSGPAGLTAAHDLRKAGYAVTIFEALPVVGGMLSVGIPNYRLPRHIFQKDLDRILKLGIEVKTGTALGKDFTIDDLFAQGYKAVFLGIGCHQGRKLDVPGEEENPQGLIEGVAFLRAVNMGASVQIGAKIAVIGGGNVAIDAARSALRLGAEKVTIAYRRSRQEMPAADEEIEAAEEEGVEINYLQAPTRLVVRDGKVAGLQMIRMELGEPDGTGRRRPVPVKGSETAVEFDTVILAIGQQTDASFLPGAAGVKITPGGAIEVNKNTLATARTGVFAGGDAVSGPAMVVDAIAAGQRTAKSIHSYLRGEVFEEPGTQETREKRAFEYEKILKHNRKKIPSRPARERIKDFEEVELAYSQEDAREEAGRCLSCGVCSECLQCVAACKANAIEHDQTGRSLNLNVGALILAPGFDEFDAALKPEYGYGVYPNVVTSIQFERIMCASGPMAGHVARPSDHGAPKKVAFIQCVGSRDPAVGRGYCSGVCCMYATKEAVIAREHNADLESAIFYMDMRSYGKDFDKYIERAKSDYGVRYVRSRVSHIEESPQTRNLSLRYETEEGEIKQEEFDMVVLSVGLDRVKNIDEVAKKLGVELNGYGFAQTGAFSPVETSRKGVFVCGAFQGPKDIPETVTQASGAASKAAGLLHEARGTLVTEKIYPPEIEIDEQTEPRVGVFVCHCGINIGGVVRVKEVVEYARKLPNVVYATDNLYTCSGDTQTSIQEKIREYSLNRVVVASCTPRTHEPLFRQTVREGGLNEYLFEMANIRDQCSWVHMHLPAEATEKAKDLVRMAVAKTRLLKPLARMVVDVDHTGIVIGGGLAGITAALEIAEQGFDVHLIEKQPVLGGNLRDLKYLVGGEDPAKQLAHLIERIEKSPRITVHSRSSVASIEGYVGNYKVTVARGENETTVNGGAIVVATGAEAYQPSEYGYGASPGIMTQRELESMLAGGKWNAQSVVMIQCVGSRNEERPYCSRVCCTNAVKNALKIKELNPRTEVYVLYRDMRTYGLYEDFYREAREKGVIFIRFSKENQPEVTVDGGKVSVSVYEPLVGVRLNLEPDVLALSAGIVADPDAGTLARMLKVPVNQDGFFLEAHMKLRPVDFATEGVFLCGLAHSPKMADETIAQACAAAARACTILSKDQIEAEGAVARVNADICTKCGICETNCPYAAIAKDPELAGKARVTEVLCKGCGVCAATCPEKAITIEHYSREELCEQIAAALEEALL